MPNSAQPMVAPFPIPQSPVLFQSWQNLLFLHWGCRPDSLADRLPPGLDLDTHGDQAWLGIIPFEMRGVRPRRLPPVPGLSNFLELNVRTYVRDRSGVPGVWFFSLAANIMLACTIARSRFHLPYRNATMQTQGRQQISYTTRRRGASQEAVYRFAAQGPATPATPGSLEHFLLERYILYASNSRSGQLLCGRVHHKPYRFREVRLEECSTLPLEWNGLPLPSSAFPDHACLVDRTDVSVYGLKPLQDPSHPLITP